jgi:hypothetical protein
VVITFQEVESTSQELIMEPQKEVGGEKLQQVEVDPWQETTKWAI